jgi:peptidoglycan/LPS O-acetylase OafA/YrhL
MERTKEHYFRQLDGLRFVAIFMVLVAHYLQWQWANVWLLKFPFTYGVTLFFVLSGFLITRILLSQSDFEPKRVLRTFYIRRIFRIFPVYYVAIFGLLLLGYENARELFPWLVTYTINIYESIHNTVAVGNFNHFWSLAVEEQFYLIWPFLVLFLPKKYFLPLTLSLVLMSVGYKVYLYEFTPNWVRNDVSLFTNFNSLGMGGILAYVYMYRREDFEKFASNKALIPLTLLAFFTVFIRTIYDLEMFKSTLMQFVWVVFFTSVIARSIIGFSGIIGFFLENPVIVYLGRISYGIYIFHQFVPSFVFASQPSWGYLLGNKYLAFVVFFGITVAISTISWYVLERPMNKLKQKF